MNSIFNNNIWSGQRCYVTAKSDLLHHKFHPDKIDIGNVCLITFSSDLFSQVLETIPQVDENFKWPYSTTSLKLCETESGKKFSLHFLSFGGTRIANSLEQLSACGVQYVFGVGLGGTLQEDIHIGDVILLEGAVRGDGVSRYYSPVEFPAVADFELTAKVREKLDSNNETYHIGLSFGTDALYREEEGLIKLLVTIQA